MEKEKGSFSSFSRPFLFHSFIKADTEREKSNVSLTEGNSTIAECETENPPPIYQKPVRGEVWILTNCHIANNVSDSEVINKSHSQAATNLYSGQAFRERGRERDLAVCASAKWSRWFVAVIQTTDQTSERPRICQHCPQIELHATPAHKRSHS